MAARFALSHPTADGRANSFVVIAVIKHDEIVSFPIRLFAERRQKTEQPTGTESLFEHTTNQPQKSREDKPYDAEQESGEVCASLIFSSAPEAEWNTVGDFLISVTNSRIFRVAISEELHSSGFMAIKNVINAIIY